MKTKYIITDKSRETMAFQREASEGGFYHVYANYKRGILVYFEQGCELIVDLNSQGSAWYVVIVKFKGFHLTSYTGTGGYLISKTDFFLRKLLNIHHEKELNITNNMLLYRLENGLMSSLN